MREPLREVVDRSLAKTPEGVLASRLRQEFELSPAVSLAVVELASECLMGEIPRTPGKLLFDCASRRARHGVPLTEQAKVRVSLTLAGGRDDVEVFRVHGSSGLRQLRVLRLTEEAYDQGGLLTQEDLAYLLHVSSRTIRNDVKALVSAGNTVHTRGHDHDIGRGVSHKARIVDLYLLGFTYDEIMWRTRHSAGAIRRYVTTFSRMLLLIAKGVTASLPLSRLLQQSERLTREYLSLYGKYLQEDEGWPPVYEDLVDQLCALDGVEKKELVGGGVDAADDQE
jgi:biotin operon repressor